MQNKIILLLIFYLLSIKAYSQEFEWAKQIGGLNAQVTEAIITDTAGNVYTAGWFRGTVDFDPGPGIYNLTCNPELGTDILENDLAKFW